MEPVYIIGAGAIGKVLAVCLGNNGKKVVLLRGSVDNGETRRENIRVTLPSQETIEAKVTIDTLSAALARAVSPPAHRNSDAQPGHCRNGRNGTKYYTNPF